jgi:ABC-type transport system involved in multi-copper enzyme maturation permease subunit
MNRIRGLLIAGRHAASDALRTKRTLVLIAVVALPLLPLLLANADKNGDLPAEVYHTAILLIAYQVVVPFSALLLGVAVIGDEIEGRTITYLHTRPVGRGTLYLGRVLGIGAAWSLLFGLILGFGLHQRPISPDPIPAELWRPVWIGIAGFWAYFTAFAVLRVLLKRALLVGMFYILLVDGFMSKMAGMSVTKLALWHHMVTVDLSPYEDYKLRGFVWAQKTIAPEETASGSWMVIAGVALASAVVGMWLARTKEHPVAGAVA